MQRHVLVADENSTMSHRVPQSPLSSSSLCPCPSHTFLGDPTCDPAYEITVELDPPDEPEPLTRARLPSEEETMV